MGRSGSYVPRVTPAWPGQRSPSYYWPSIVVKQGWSNWLGKRFRPGRDELMKQDKAAREITVGGYLTPIPLIYGKVAVGSQIVFVGVSGSTGRKLHLVMVIGEGEIGGYDDILYQGKSVIPSYNKTTESGVPLWKIGPTGGQQTKCYLYTGTSGQTYPPELHAAFPAYTDTLTGKAYVYVQHDRYNEVISGFPELTFVVRGRKIYDPRTTLTAYSNNPALALADALSHATVGLGKTIDWDSVEAVADACDETVNGKPRRTIGLAIRGINKAPTIINTLREHAGAFLYEDSGTIFMVADRPREVSHYITDDHILKDSLNISFRQNKDLPTIVEVTYTDPGENNTLWRDEIYREVAPGSLPDRVARYHMPGITDPSEARRTAKERVNRSLIVNRDILLRLADYGLKIVPGDVMSITESSLGLSGDEYTVVTAKALNPGSWEITGESYGAVYSNHVWSRSDWADVDMDDPNDPPIPAGLAVNEVPFVLGDGRWATRFEITWDDMKESYSHIREYRIRVTSGSEIFYEGSSLTNSKVTGSLQDQASYVVEVMSVSTTGKISDAAEYNITASLPVPIPSDVPAITQCIEAGGWLLMRWLAASGYGIEGYIIKRGETTDDWDSASYFVVGSLEPGKIKSSAHKSTNLQAKDIPEGTWRIFIKAVDVRERLSANAAYADVTVTADTSFKFSGEHSWAAEDFTLEKMCAYEIEGLGWSLVPDDGESIEEGYVTENPTWNDDDMGTVPLCLPRTSYGSGVYALSDAWDLGSVLGGQWSMGGISTEDIENGDNAGVTVYISLSDDDISYTDHAGMSVRASGRYAKIKIVDAADGPDAATVIRLLPATLNLYVETREESGEASVTVDQPYHVTLTGSYGSYVEGYPIVQYVGINDYKVFKDNITNTGFDIYLRDASLDPVAGTVGWIFKGA